MNLIISERGLRLMSTATHPNASAETISYATGCELIRKEVMV